MKVCYFGTYRASYVRNVVMIERLRRVGVEVIECHETLWHGIDDRINIATGGWINPTFWRRLIKAYWQLTIRYLNLQDHEIVVVGYPGQLDVYLARVLSWIRRKPLVWDICTSSYLVAKERGLDEKSKLSISLLRIIEYFACRLPNLLIHITYDYILWYGKTFAVPENRFKIVPIGADDRIFCPKNFIKRKESIYQVLYFGTYIPNHRVETIIEAANQLKGCPKIHFLMIGTGPDENKCRELKESYRLSNVDFLGWMGEDELVDYIARADLILGIFGETPQSLFTVHNKIYTGLAMKKTVLTADSPAVKREMIHGTHLYLCNRKDPRSLANAIIFLSENLEYSENLANQGYGLYQNKFTLDKLGIIYKNYLEVLLQQVQ